MASISSTIIRSRRNHFLQVEVDFDDLDNAYEDQQLNFSKDISEEDPFISRFSPRIFITHSCANEESNDIFVLAFKNIRFLKCHFRKFHLEVVQSQGGNPSSYGLPSEVHERSYFQPDYDDNGDEEDNGELAVYYDILNQVYSNHPGFKIKRLKCLLTITFQPDEEVFLKENIQQEFSILNMVPQQPEDFGIRCQNEEVKFNKTFLCKISDVFATMIENPLTVESRQSFVNIENVNISVVKTFKRILCEQKPSFEDFDCELLLFADRYNIQPLVKMCKTYLDICQENIFEVIKTADALNDDELLKGAAEFISEHKGSFTKDPEWKKLIKDNPRCFAKMMELVMFE